MPCHRDGRSAWAAAPRCESSTGTARHPASSMLSTAHASATASLATCVASSSARSRNADTTPRRSASSSRPSSSAPTRAKNGRGMGVRRPAPSPEMPSAAIAWRWRTQARPVSARSTISRLAAPEAWATKPMPHASSSGRWRARCAARSKSSNRGTPRSRDDDVVWIRQERRRCRGKAHDSGRIARHRAHSACQHAVVPDAPGGRPAPLVAVLGGGQLGRMLALAGIPLGLDFRFLDPVPDAAAGAVGPLVVGALDDESALARVGDGAAVVTYEWEGVPAHGARFVGARGAPVLPPPVALDVSQDRLREKELCRRLGIGTPAFVGVDDRPDLERAVKELGTPSVLKTRRGGYDGKGQTVLDKAHDIERAWSELGGVPLMLEAHVPFERELSVLAVRDRDGGAAGWRLVEHHHYDGVRGGSFERAT